jgi:hypothetical protein
MGKLTRKYRVPTDLDLFGEMSMQPNVHEISNEIE